MKHKLFEINADRNAYLQDTHKIDTIIIIGNGFDIWQGLNTSYSSFQKYYLAHRDEILKKLHIKKHIFLNQDGNKIECSDVELIYGNPFEPSELEDEFWNTFEASLNQIDAEQLNSFFGKKKSELREMNRSIKNAGRILREAFCNWIASINIDAYDAGYEFGDNCLFINFNYTDTLLKCFSVKEINEFHIHGEAVDKESIIFGHSSHPQEPECALSKFGGRFLGLYYVDRILYETDKHCQDNIQLLCMFLAIHGAISEDIKNIYVLGHSMGPADTEYFNFLVRSTQIPEENNDTLKEKMCNDDLMNELHSRLQYAIEATGYGHQEIEDVHTDAILRRLEQEQDVRNAMYKREFMKMFGKISKKDIKKVSETVTSRTEEAKWHISYYSERDRKWAEFVMRELGCKNYELYSSIDECLGLFRKSK